MTQIEGRVVKLLVAAYDSGDVDSCIKRFRQTYPEAVIDAINDREVVGFCESCGRPFYEDDGRRHYQDSDGIRWCEDCAA